MKFIRGIAAAYEMISAEVDNVTLLPSNEWGVEIWTDGTHPTPEGYEHLGDCVADVLKNII